MDWTEIIIKVPVNQLEKAENISNMVVPYGIYVEDYQNLEQEVLEIANIDLIDEELLQKDRGLSLIHIYISPDESPMEAVAYLEERFSAEGVDFTIDLASCKEENWINNWKNYFHPIEVGNRLLIRPTWRDEYNANGRVVLNLDPGLAFGTGTHETTRLCLCMLEKYLSDDMSVLDVGCGSGILGISALLLGAGNAVGVDIDALAVKTAKENAELNGVSDKINILCGNLTDKITGKYDIVTANIVADAIIMLSGSIRSFMKENAVYIMSGIIDSRVSEVKACLEENNLLLIDEIEEKGWYCLVAKLK